MPTTKHLIPGIEAYPDLRHRFIHEYRAASHTGCAHGCDKAKVLQRYTAMVAARRQAR